jgi:uncharacterized protein (DUF58 family)
VRQLERLSLVQLDAVVAGFAGSHPGPRGTSGIEFADYRRYTPGDDLRRIDWQVYARLREPFVKTAPGEARIGIALMVDASASMDWPPGATPTKLRHAQRVAAMLAAVALLRADSARISSLADGSARIGVVLTGPSALPIAIEQIDAQPVGRRTDLASAVREHRLATRPPDLAVLLTDALVPDPALDAALDELAYSARGATLVHVTAPEERTPPAEGAVQVVDRESGERRVVDRSPEAVARYARRADERAQALRRRCAARDIAYVPAPTDVPALEVLFDAGRRAGLVGD